MRRVRATFLLRCVILLACLLAFGAVLHFGLGTPWAGGVLVVALVTWFVGIELDVLPLAIEHVVVRRAARRGVPARSLWFVDLEQQRARDRARFHDDTSDNPTIR